MRVCNDDLTLYIDQRASGLWVILADPAGPVMIDADLEDKPTLDGTVWRGKVTGVQDGVGVFLTVGDPVGEVFLRYPRREEPPQPGQTLLVCLQPAIDGTKRPRATTELALPGRTVVHFPNGRRQVRFPKRVAFPSPQWRADVDQALKGRPGTWAVRRNAMTGIDPQEIADEADWLQGEAEALDGLRDGEPGLVREGPDALDRVLVHQPPPRRAVVCDEEVAGWMEEEDLPAEIVEDPFAALDLDTTFAEAMAERVRVSDVVDLWIEYTRLGWTIDIDCRTKPHDGVLDQAFSTLLRQLRIRNLSGQMLVDPPRMPEDRQRDNLVRRLKRASEFDPAGLDIYDISALGLVEMVRTRRGYPLAQILAADSDFAQLVTPAAAKALLGAEDQADDTND